MSRVARTITPAEATGIATVVMPAVALRTMTSFWMSNTKCVRLSWLLGLKQQRRRMLMAIRMVDSLATGTVTEEEEATSEGKGLLITLRVHVCMYVVEDVIVRNTEL